MFLGVEIGGTKLQLGVCDRHGRVKLLERRSVERRRGAAGILQQIEQIAPALLGRVQAIGVGFGGPFDTETGRAVRSHQIAGWAGFPVKRWFERKFRLPAFVDNDQNCAALAEATVGAGKGKRVVFYVTVGTGIGGGLVIDGELYNGRYGAAEIGHMVLWTRRQGRLRHDRTAVAQAPLPVQAKTVEAVASGLAIERGVSTVAQSARYVGIAIANAIALLNPDIVIVGGGVATAGAKFFRPLRATVRRYVFPVFRNNYRIVPPALGQSVVVVGAALLARMNHEGRRMSC
jgi:glucokinase